jgi:hypothetical protein
MTQAEQRLIEQGWDALVAEMGVVDATRFVMLLDRRTGGALQHLRVLWAAPAPGQQRRGSASAQPQSAAQFDAS